MWKRLAVVICSLAIIGSNQVGQLSAAEEQGGELHARMALLHHQPQHVLLQRVGRRGWV